MIYLFTGNMGAGKTPRVVSMILNNEDGLFKMELEDGTEANRRFISAISTDWTNENSMPANWRKGKSCPPRFVMSYRKARC